LITKNIDSATHNTRPLTPPGFLLLFSLPRFSSIHARFGARLAPVLAILIFLTLFLIEMGLAYAEEGNATQLYVSESVRHESNLFRLSSTNSSLALINKPSYAETIYTTAMGLKFDKSYSLQRVQIDVNTIDYRYRNFSYLNFTAFNYRAGWLWSVTPNFYGNVASSRDKTLNSFSDFLSINQRNERISTSSGVDATYEMGARWRLLGSLMATAQTNRQPLISESGSRQTVINSGLRYEFPSGTHAGLVLRNYNGTYTDQAPSFVNRLENSFVQNEEEINVLWKISEKTNTNFALIYLTRYHPNFSERNYRGLAGNARVTWLISAKSALNVELRRDIAAFQTSSTNYSTADRLSIGPEWQISTKSRLGMQLRVINRQYGGTPGLGIVSDRSDVSREAALALEWRPFSSVNVNASLQNSRRSASDPRLNYKNNNLTVSAKFSF